MSDRISVVILAAGKGTRLKLNQPKPLVKAVGRALVDYIISAVESLDHDKVDITVITGHAKELVEDHINQLPSKNKINFVHQREQKGTGHAVQEYMAQSPNASDYTYTFIMCADTPLLSKATLENMITRLKQKDSSAVCASFVAQNPHGYGRIIKSDKGFKITEEKDASESEKLIKEVNSGLYLIKTSYLVDALKSLDDNNASGEFYLTDVFKPGADVEALCFDSEEDFLGVNDLVQLHRIERSLRLRKNIELLESGVRLIDIENTYIDTSVEIGEGTLIHPNSVLQGQTKIGKNCVVESGCVIKSSEIDSDVSIYANSYIEKAKIQSHCQIGPYARLREGSHLAESVKIGNFVESKKSFFDTASKVSHLSYVGDAEIGARTNIGCGFITCNYDGANKHKTKIGSDCFIGSDSQAIAPVEIGDECFVASGSTINQSMPKGSFAISRTRQTTKEGLAKKFIKKKSNP